MFAAASQANFVDLHVYRMGGDAVLHDGSLYGLRFAWLTFTYPPFAAIVFTVLAALPWTAAAALLTAASAVALPVTLYLALRLMRSPSADSPTAPGVRGIGSPVAWRLALLAGAGAIWLEPARTTLTYGQIDILLTAAVLYDLALPDGARRKGVAIGLAAGLKLTPAIFVAYLLITRRFRAAATAVAVFAGTVAAGFALLPAASAWYWAGTFASPGHIGAVQDVANQSLLGALARATGTAHVWPVWLPLAMAVTAAGLALAAAAERRGDQALGFSLCAVTGLLVSPISWTHHWVIAIPALLLAGMAVYHSHRDGQHAVAVSGAVAIMAIAAVGWARLARDAPGSGWLSLPASALAKSMIYVLAGLSFLALASAFLLRDAIRAHRRA